MGDDEQSVYVAAHVTVAALYERRNPNDWQSQTAATVSTHEMISRRKSVLHLLGVLDRRALPF